MTESAIIFALPEYMTIETAEALAAELKQLPIGDKTSLTLDAGRVESITTPGVQLIVATEKALASQGGSLRIINKREAFTHAFCDLGLERMIKE